MSRGSEQTTRRPRGDSPSSGSPQQAVVLTILCHPDLGRVGEWSVLWPSPTLECSVQLSRLIPEFGRGEDVWESRSLEDPFVSRDPWLLVREAGGIWCTRGHSSTELIADGVEVRSEFLLPNAAVDRGVVLELAERIALLLHRRSAASLIDPTPSPAYLVGSSEPLLDVVAAINRVADLEVPVLLRGESGTGKELAARALHERSDRSSRPFVAVNLGALPTSLAASELFGHVKGAFTGASSAREGYFSAADGGTLFLDEVGEAPPEIQAMLLRTLETGEIVPVGSHVARRVDVRVIAATDSDLESRAQRGDFKEPLFHRLSAYVIRLPALRDRPDDIGTLFVHFARRTLAELSATALAEPRHQDEEPWIEASLMSRLVRYPWPGNVRQLKNVARQLVIDSRGTKHLRPGSRLGTLLTEPPAVLTETPAEVDAETKSPSSPPGMEHVEPKAARQPSQVTDRELEEEMVRSRYEPAAAARRLGVSRASIYNLIRRHPTLRVAEDVPQEEVLAALEAAQGEVPEAARCLGVSSRALARRLARS